MVCDDYRLGESRLESLHYLKKKKEDYYGSSKSKGAQSKTLAPPRAIIGHLSAFVFVKLPMTHGGVSRFTQKTLPHGDKAEKSSSLKEAKTTSPHRG